jgi:two-component system sensor histidine kinase CpxA
VSVRSVFLKIFLWFWLTVIAIGLTLVVTTLALRHGGRTDEDWQHQVFIYLAVEAKLAAESYEQHGAEGLDRLLRSSPLGKAGPYLFFVDAQGREVRGNPILPQARRLAAVVNAEVPFSSATVDGDHVAARWVAGPSGRAYKLVLILPRVPVRLILTTLGTRAVVGLIAVILVAGILCFWLARHITRPLVRLGETVSQLADGRLETRVDASIRQRRDEIGGLGQSFDRMAERIASLVDSHRRLLSVVSHELRSPLTRLSLALGLLRQCTEAEKVEFLDRTELEAEHLDKLIGQLLTLAKIDAGSDLDRAQAFDLGTLVQEVAADGNFEAQRRCCSVKADSPDSLVMRGVAENVRRAIENPVRNAIRHTMPNTSVEITMQRRGAPQASVALIQIRDHGPGVPSDSLEKIFLPFHKVAGPTATDGAGLGLAITERIVRSHGGNVRATNASDGGLIVEMELPLAE